MTVLFSRRGVSRWLPASCLVLLTLGEAGCGNAKGGLSGTISYQGKAVVLGSVLLIGTDGKPRTAWIEEDGSYCFTDVPVGDVKLAVYSPKPVEQDKPRKSDSKGRHRQSSVEPEMPAVDRTKWLLIPEEYSHVDRSGLRVTINPGPNTFNIEMK